jgi:hypothetical protein
VIDMSAKTTKFNFTGCFYSNSNDNDEMICNVTVACAIALVLIGSCQDTNINRAKLLDKVAKIAKDRKKDAATKTNDVRKKLGKSIRYSVSGIKLVANENGATPVNEIEVLFNCDWEMADNNKFYLIPLLLAYFNLPNTIRERYKQVALGYLKFNRYLYTVLNIMLYKFNTNYPIDEFYINGACWLPPFADTTIVGVNAPTVDKLEITLPAELEKEQDRNVIAGYLEDIKTAIDAVIPTIEENDTSQTIPKTNGTDSNDSWDDSYDCSDRCNSFRKIFKKRLHITLFVIAAAALLAGGAVALTTYFHVGTTLMLAAGFIPFLNFVGGFQISLLLGVVTVAAACAGGTLVKKKTKCCQFKCLKGKGSDVTSNEPKDFRPKFFRA